MKSKFDAILQQIKDQKIEVKKERDILNALSANKPLVSYIGWTGHNNLGDEILYQAHQALFPRLSFVPYRAQSVAAVVRSLQGKQLYVAGFLGGGTLINQSPAWIRKIARLERQNLPIYCFGTGVTENEFRMAFEKTSIEEWTKTLARFDFVGIRGPRSMKLLKQAGFKKAQQIGDTALALAPAKAKKRPAGKVIGLNYGLVKENQIWGDADTYTDNMVATAKQLIAAGYELHLLPVWDKDIESNQKLLERINSPKCTMRLCFDSLENYTKELDQCSLFIGQKLHASIMACMERIPTIMIEYQPKCRDFMASVDMEDYVIKTSDCDPKTLMALTAKLEKNKSAVAKRLDERVSYYRALQYKLAKQIEDKLLQA